MSCLCCIKCLSFILKNATLFDFHVLKLLFSGKKSHLTWKQITCEHELCAKFWLSHLENVIRLWKKQIQSPSELFILIIIKAAEVKIQIPKKQQ